LTNTLPFSRLANTNFKALFSQSTEYQLIELFYIGCLSAKNYQMLYIFEIPINNHSNEEGTSPFAFLFSAAVGGAKWHFQVRDRY
jgi:hypothetical protein